MNPRTADAPQPRLRRLLCAGLALLGGCAAPGTASKKTAAAPAVAVPRAFDEPTPDASPAVATAVDPTWWTAFGDPVLDRLVQGALANSEELRIADARVREAEADYAAAKTGRKPSVDAVAEYRRQHLPPNDRNKDPLVSQYAVTGIDATWEADLFGRIRNLTAAAGAVASARRAERDARTLALASDLTRTYFEFRGQQAALAGARTARDLAAEEPAWIERRIAGGTANASDLAAARLALASREADLAELENREALTLHRLSLLSTVPTSELRGNLDAPSAFGAEPAAPVVANPSALLQQRADIRVAELELAASRAIDSASHAELLPRLTFSGQLSFFAFGWGLGPTLQWDLFDRARVKAREAKAGAQADAAFARYQLAVREAVSDVEDALSTLNSSRERRDKLKTAAHEATTLADYARRREAQGLANRLDVAEADLAASKARAELEQQEAKVRAAWADLYQALGGGWSGTATTPGR